MSFNLPVLPEMVPQSSFKAKLETDELTKMTTVFSNFTLLVTCKTFGSVMSLTNDSQLNFAYIVGATPLIIDMS